MAGVIPGKSSNILKIPLVLAIIVLVLIPYTPTAAQADTMASSRPDVNDASNLKTFMDGMVEKQMAENHVPGAIVAIVKNGSIIYARGYGYADLENHTPVVADRTLFRIGSVSKLFTVTAVMQLVEEGKLDLDADVNIYLKDFKIPDTYPRPVTLRHLLTHTAGFEENGAYGRTILFDRDRMVPSGEYLAGNMPARIRPPGTMAVYSNYGLALLGYVVEQASGMSYDEYVERNILSPLGMNSTSSRQPLPPMLAVNMSNGYNYENGTYNKASFEYVALPPAGSISSTAPDMARFAIAHLNDGRYGNISIFNGNTSSLMHSRQFANDPGLDGMCFDFYEENMGDMRAIGHGGATNLFTSHLVLVPSERLALFISANSPGGGKMNTGVIKEFFNHYYPVSQSHRPMEGYKERTARYAGTYYPLRSSFVTNQKILGSLSQFDVTANENGTITVPDRAGMQGIFLEVAPGLFQKINSTDKIAFRAGSNGGTEYLFTYPFLAFKKAEWYETLTFHLALLALCLAIFLSALIVWPAKYFHDHRKAMPANSLPGLAKWASTAASALGIVVVLGLAGMFLFDRSIDQRIPTELYIILIIALIVVTLTAAAIVFTLLAWKDKYWSRPERIYHTAVTAALLAFVLLLYYWNLIGFKF